MGNRSQSNRKSMESSVYGKYEPCNTNLAKGDENRAECGGKRPAVHRN
jgi:hypothetical protein